jgi:Sulfotransferase domain
MTTDPTRVLYISGAGRSGTTVLNDILDTLDDVSAFGEVWHVWKAALDSERRCGCTLLLADCPVWGPTTREYGSVGDVRKIEALRLSVSRVRHIWLIGRRLRRGDPKLRSFAGTAVQTYESLAATTQCTTLVDSSKTPAFAMLVGSQPEVALRVIHLVRDPRAVVASWSRTKTSQGANHVETLEARGLGHVLREWVFFNTVGLSLLRRRFPTLVVRLEDLVADPRTTLEAIRGFAGIDGSDSLVGADDSIIIGGAHTVAGNPDRFKRGPLRLRPNDEWRTSLSRIKRALITAATYPMLRRYGYK